MTRLALISGFMAAFFGMPALAQSPGHICYAECDRHFTHEESRCMDHECAGRAMKAQEACYEECAAQHGVDERGRCFIDATGGMVCRSEN